MVEDRPLTLHTTIFQGTGQNKGVRGFNVPFDEILTQSCTNHRRVTTTSFNIFNEQILLSKFRERFMVTLLCA